MRHFLLSSIIFLFLKGHGRAMEKANDAVGDVPLFIRDDAAAELADMKSLETQLEPLSETRASRTMQTTLFRATKTLVSWVERGYIELGVAANALVYMHKYVRVSKARVPAGAVPLLMRACTFSAFKLLMPADSYEVGARRFLHRVKCESSRDAGADVCDVEREVLVALQHRLHVVTVVDAAMWMQRSLEATGWPHAPLANVRIAQVMMHLMVSDSFVVCLPTVLAAAAWMLVLSSMKATAAMACVVYYFGVDEADVTAAVQQYLLN